MADYPIGELARVFPPLAADDFEKLVESISQDGLLEPIIVWRGEVIDGYHRYQACAQAGVERRYVELPDDTDPVRHVIARNDMRRHLNTSQRAVIAHKLSEWSMPGGRRELYPRTGRKAHESRYSRFCGNATVVNQQEAAKLLQVSTDSVHRARKVLRPESPATPELKQVVEQGVVTVTDAAAIVNKPAEVQQEAIELVVAAQEADKQLPVRQAVKTVERERVKAAWAERQAERRAAPKLNDVELIHASCADLSTSVAAASVDLILTDPPYQPDTLSCYQDLAEFAAHALKPGGVLLAMAGTSHLPAVLGYLCNTPGLTYHWTLNYLMDGANLRFHTRAVRMGWKPVIWLVKGGSDGTDRYDVVKAPALAAQDTRYHDWGQNEGGFKLLLELFAFPGQVVCDPFVGGGTTAVVAHDMGCAFIGADIDPTCLEATSARLLRAKE